MLAESGALLLPWHDRLPYRGGYPTSPVRRQPFVIPVDGSFSVASMTITRAEGRSIGVVISHRGRRGVLTHGGGVRRPQGPHGSQELSQSMDTGETFAMTEN
jgi:hypothetical protein